MTSVAKSKYRLLKAMDAMIYETSSDSIYEEWIEAFPSEPLDSDYWAIATNKAAFKEVFELFKDLITREDYL